MVETGLLANSNRVQEIEDIPIALASEDQERISAILDFILRRLDSSAVMMHPTYTARSSALRAVLVALLTGVFLRLAIFANNMYYPDIGIPYNLGVPALGTLFVGIVAYLVSRYAEQPNS